MTPSEEDVPDPAAGLALRQERLWELREEGALPDADYLCVRVYVGSGFLGLKRITKEGIVVLRDGHLVVAGEGEVIAQGPVGSLNEKWLYGSAVYVRPGPVRYGLDLTLGSVLIDGEPLPPTAIMIKGNAAVQGRTDAGKRFRQALARAQGKG